MKAATGLGTSSHANPAISIHAAREGGDARNTEACCKRLISIHAAREGGDLFACACLGKLFEISIHAAREGGDADGIDHANTSAKFQSTPPVKAATFQNVFRVRLPVFQSTPPVKAATKPQDTL